jgi:hypothetical protein
VALGNSTFLIEHTFLNVTVHATLRLTPVLQSGEETREEMKKGWSKRGRWDTGPTKDMLVYGQECTGQKQHYRDTILHSAVLAEHQREFHTHYDGSGVRIV